MTKFRGMGYVGGGESMLGDKYMLREMLDCMSRGMCWGLSEGCMCAVGEGVWERKCVLDKFGVNGNGFRRRGKRSRW